MARKIRVTDEGGKLTVLADDEPLEGVLAVRLEHGGAGPIVQITLEGVQEIHFRKPPDEETWV